MERTGFMLHETGLGYWNKWSLDKGLKQKLSMHVHNLNILKDYSYLSILKFLNKKIKLQYINLTQE